MKLALLAAALLFAAGSANATSNNVIVVPAWTLSGYQVVKANNTSQIFVFPVNITNFSTLEECEIAKNKQNTELATAPTSGSAGSFQATDSIFTGSCIKVKEFVFAPNLF